MAAKKNSKEEVVALKDDKKKERALNDALDLPFTQKLLHIYEALGEQLEHCAPDFMSVERLFFGRNITTAEFVWQARGVVMLLAARKGLPVLEPKPNQIKLAVCGTGGADKTQVQRMVQRLLGLDAIPSPDDAADALAAALAGLAYYDSAFRPEAERAAVSGGDLP